MAEENQNSAAEPEREEKLIGKITLFYGNISVGVIELSDSLSAGDMIHIKGSSSDFDQTVDSMQIEHEQVEKAEAGQAVGMKVAQKVHEGDQVYKVM